jgi:hypothetical protein
MRTILTDALNHAERRQLVGRNAGRLSILPACTPTPEGRSLTAEEADAFVPSGHGPRRGSSPPSIGSGSCSSS